MARPPGSSTLLTPELTKKICADLAICVPEKYAAEANGIAEETFHSWMRKGAAGGPEFEPYVVFREAVTRARATAVARMHRKALLGGKGSSAATWMLERRFHNEYGPRMRVENVPPDPLATISDADLESEISITQGRVEAFEQIRKTRIAQAKAAPEGS